MGNIVRNGNCFKRMIFWGLASRWLELVSPLEVFLPKMFCKGHPPRQRCVINSFFSFRAHQKSYFYKSFFFLYTHSVYSKVDAVPWHSARFSEPNSLGPLWYSLAELFFCEKRSVFTTIHRNPFHEKPEFQLWNLFALRLMNSAQRRRYHTSQRKTIGSSTV